jgi:hypothetical protein
MRIDITRETPIPLADVPKLHWLPRRRLGRRLHLATVYRWALRGLRSIRLEYVQLGGCKVTTEAALIRFFQSLTITHTESTRQPSQQREDDHRRVEKELDSRGI